MTEAHEHSAPHHEGQSGLPAQGGHETRDVSVGNLAAFGLILLGLIILGLLVSWGVQSYFFKHQSLGPTATPFENVRETPPANRPPLQTEPAEDMGAFRLREHKTLETYGWVDAKTGIARIPIERAMAILLQKGFPTEASAPPSGNAKAATDKKGKKQR